MGSQRVVLAGRAACALGVRVQSYHSILYLLKTDVDCFLAHVHRSADKTIKVWDIGARAAVSTIQDTGEVWSVSWRPLAPAPGSAGAFVTGGEDGAVKVWRSAGAS